jgi:nitronate monooxygenase
MMTPSPRSSAQAAYASSVVADIASRLTLPVIAAPMFLISDPKMVIACCRSGIIGTFPALNQRTSEGFAGWLREITAALSTSEHMLPFGVNLIVHPTNPRLPRDVEICRDFKVPLVITSLGAATDVVDQVHSYGGLIFHDVVNRRHAEKAAAAGVDGLVLVCGGAGGHAGTANPFAFISEVRSFFDGVIILSGGIATGAHVAAARVAGADFAYMGTRFIATQDSSATPEYKRLILESGIQDVIYTPAVSGVPANFLRGSLEQTGLLKDGEVRALGPQSHAVDDGAATGLQPWKDIWSAGHGVGAISDVPDVANLVARMKIEYRSALTRLS